MCFFIKLCIFGRINLKPHNGLMHPPCGLPEKPSAPYCAVHGDVESGHLVTLTCHSERGSPTPTYTWTRLDQTKTRMPVLGRGERCICVFVRHLLTSIRSLTCALVSSVTTTGILEIRNISQFEFGEYQCNATNAVGYSTCTIELSAGMFVFQFLRKCAKMYVKKTAEKARRYKNACLCRCGRRSDCRRSDRRVARLRPDHPGRVVHRSHHEEAQIQNCQSSRGQRDEVRPRALNVDAFHHVTSNSGVSQQLPLCPLGGSLPRPRKPRTAFPRQPQAAASMLREMKHEPKKRPVANNWSDVTVLNNRMFSL